MTQVLDVINRDLNIIFPDDIQFQRKENFMVQVSWRVLLELSKYDQEIGSCQFKNLLFLDEGKSILNDWIYLLSNNKLVVHIQWMWKV